MGESRQFLNISGVLCLFFARGAGDGLKIQILLCTRFNFTIVEQIEIVVGALIQITSDQIKLCKAAASKLQLITYNCNELYTLKMYQILQLNLLLLFEMQRFLF